MNSAHSYSEGAEVPEDKTTDNELIAQFMGLLKDSSGDYLIKDFPQIRATAWCSPHFLDFHKSWDWLMPVVEKIASISAREFNYDVTGMTQLRLNKDRVLTLPIICPIETLYQKVVEFIRWYNGNKLESLKNKPI